MLIKEKFAQLSTILTFYSKTANPAYFIFILESNECTLVDPQFSGFLVIPFANS